MSRRRLRLAVLTVAALCALGAALVVAFATTGSSSNTQPISKFAAADPDSAAAKFGTGNELRGLITPADWEATMRAYPASQVSPKWTQNARNTFSRIASRSPKAPPGPALNVWQNYGPQHLATEPGVLNFSGRDFQAASRTASIAIDPACPSGPPDAGNCRMWIGPVGGGVWRTDNALAVDPVWTFISSPFASNSVGEIVLSPFNSSVVYVGTGEPNSCSSGCEAGVGIYRSPDGGNSWTKLASSCVSNATYSCITPGQDAFFGRGISEIVIDPTNGNHLLVGSATAARSISHIIGLGGQVRFNEPGANPTGLYESLDGGATFTPVWVPNPAAQIPPASLSPAPGRRGVIDVGIDPSNPAVVYASAFSMGVFRRCPTAVAACGGEASAGATDFKQVWAPRNPAAGASDVERTQIDLTITPSGPAAGNTRIYLTSGQVGISPGGDESPASFWRLDNANQTAATLLASEAAGAVPPAGSGNPFPATYTGWQNLTAASTASPYWATHNFCTGQCWYDQEVYTPKHPTNPTILSALRPNEVYVMGSYLYGELPCDTKGVGCGSGISNGRGVLWSTTAGDPDPSASNRTFTDMTIDVQNQDAPWCAFGFVPGYACRWAFNSIHPDQHEIVVIPSNPNRFIEASDGGMIRTDGQFANASPLCTLRGLGGSAFTQCVRLLSRVPEALHTLNTGISNTLQFVGVAANPLNPCQIIAGTQDNSTWTNPNCDHNDWPKTIYGDGGNAGFDTYPDVGPSATGQPWMFNEFTSGFTDANFRGGDPEKWVIISGPLVSSGETVAFYWPQISDPNPPTFGGAQTHPIFSGLRHVWRSWAWGAGHVSTPQQTAPDISFYEANCKEFITFGGDPSCGDFQPLGGPAGTDTPGDLAGTTYGADRTGGAVSWIARRAADNNTMWALTSGGRVFLTRNANAPDPASVIWYRVDNLPQAGNPCPANPDAPNCSPTRHPNAVYPDPLDPNVAYVSYSGYNPTTPAAPGHVFRVTVTPVSGTPTGVTFTNLNVEMGSSAFPTPTNTGDLPVNDVVMDDPTGNLYAATDFGVLMGTPDGLGGYTWAVTPGMPRLEVSHLAMVPGQRDACRASVCSSGRVLYAATHSQGIWVNRLG